MSPAHESISSESPAFARRRDDRRGVAILECVVAALMVMAMLSITAPLVIRTGRLWKQTRNVQLALDELGAQLDALIAMAPDQRQSELDQLDVSSATRNVLGDATLRGSIVHDEDGKRLSLSIDWPRIGDPPPLTLVAWIDPLPPEANSNDPAASPEEDSDQ
ncbi:hypothetical protein FYK55_09625 [Roseiconus nitratireducens]|uniref:Prepilin-type N-terminal cleavage/methylation domain-containing protein n=1 Tax=Roseiconus nitratireducens TaxID=2605748 RepID=A0A5M6DAI6_9BACT|nr:hypothetical protein [Roseiconus nitratireducens]KAA5544568.1 hypothetical protein FYK55_09625 [Roseiconus nitratireducens]